MTTTEAQRLADRLTRVWGILDVEWGFTHENFFRCWGRIGGLHFDWDEEYEEVTIYSADQVHWLGLEQGVFDEPLFQAAGMPEKVPLQSQFAAQHLPAFRRRAFLSGYPIEHTATERLEWTRDARTASILTDEEARELLCLTN